MLSTLKTLSIDGIVLKQLFVNDVLSWELPSSFKNWFRYSINADGTIYNDGLGYKNGYRVRSGGAEAETPYYAITGYIPVKGGDVIRVGGVDGYYLTENANAFNVSDSSFTNLGQAVKNSSYGIFQETAYADYKFGSVVKEADGVYKWVVPPHNGIAYVRLTIYSYTLNCEDIIVTVNEEVN